MDFRSDNTPQIGNVWNAEIFDTAIAKRMPSLLQLININKVKEVLRCKRDYLPKFLEAINKLNSNKDEIEYILRHMTEHEKTVHQFIYILLHTGQDAAAYILALIFSINLIPFIDLSISDPSLGYVINEKDKIGENPYTTTDSMSRAYKFIKPGLCFLVNNYFTPGTHQEMVRFRNIFYQLGFKVILKKNLDAKDIYLELLKTSKSVELSNYDSFLFMSISHGTENGEIIGFDELPIKIELLTELFNNEECPQLRGQPRMFFFNCCRGGDTDEGTTSLSGPSAPWMKPNIPTISDFLICYSTLQGYVANVDWMEGTCFGKWLSASFIERSKYKELDAVLRRANEMAEDEFCSRSPTAQRGFHQIFDWTVNMKRQVYFFAKYWKKEEHMKINELI